MRKLRVVGILVVIACVLSPNLSLATETSSGGNDSRIQELLTIIRDLQSKIVAMQSDISQTKADVAEIKQELHITKTLHAGMKDEEVKALQSFLSQYPEFYPEGSVTGYFGPKTEVAVKKFQEKNGLEPVGIVGPKTRSILAEKFQKRVSGETASGEGEEGHRQTGGADNTDTVSKVIICHRSGDTGNMNTLTVSSSAVPALLSQGDTLGECPVGNVTPPPPTTPAGDSVILKSVFITDASVTVAYAKNFPACTHLLTENNTLLHEQNYFCGDYAKGFMGDTVTTLTAPSAVVDLGLSVGQRVKLCHGNNYNICSGLVTVTGGGSTVTPPQIEAGTVLRIVGAYETAGVEHNFCSGGTGTISVDVPSSTVPVILVLTAYEPVNWVVNAQADAHITKIILAGYNAQSVTGVSAPVERYTFYSFDKYTPGPAASSPGQGAFYDSRVANGIIYHWAGDASCKTSSALIPLESRRYFIGNPSYFYAYQQGTEEYTKLVEKLKTITGLTPSSFTGQYSATHIVLPALSGSTPTSASTPVPTPSANNPTSYSGLGTLTVANFSTITLTLSGTLKPSTDCSATPSEYVLDFGDGTKKTFPMTGCKEISFSEVHPYFSVTMPGKYVFPELILRYVEGNVWMNSLQKHYKVTLNAQQTFDIMELPTDGLKG